jgi:hypothetical protein
MRILALIVVVTVCSAFAFAQMDCPGKGQIEGKVVDSDGLPVANAEVTVLPEQCVITGFKVEVKTKADGSFVLSGVPSGLNGVHAQKPESGYPDTTAAIYDDDSAPAPKVVVRSGETVPGVIVRLGKKAGFVSGEVVDEETSQPVVTARVRMSVPENDRIMLSMGVNRGGHFELLVPARPVRLVVRAPGYSAWQFIGNQEPAGVIRLRPEERRELSIKLHKEKN